MTIRTPICPVTRTPNQTRRRKAVPWMFTGGVPNLPPLDILNAEAAFGTRKLRTAYAGSCIRVRRSSDNAEQDIGFIGTSLDTASLLSFVGGGSGYITKWYDQSGNARDGVQATSANQPRIVNSGAVESALVLSGSQWLTTSAILSGTGDFTLAGWVKLTNATTENPLWAAFGTENTGGVDFYVFQSKVTFFPPSVVGAVNISNDTWVHIAVVREAGVIKLYADGTADSSAAAVSNFSAALPMRIGTGYTGVGFLSGLIADAFYFTSALTLANIQLIKQSVALGLIASGFWQDASTWNDSLNWVD